jgi:23S rRNA (uracil1939-C5)-methyltransferase
MSPLFKNQLIPIQIENYSSEGDGVGHVDGCAVFVRGALRGETVQARILKVSKTCAWAKVEQVLSLP